jgi:non-heme chloroperoxidase
VLARQGGDHQIVLYPDSAPLTAKLGKNGTLKTYKGFPHGMITTEAATTASLSVIRLSAAPSSC